MRCKAPISAALLTLLHRHRGLPADHWLRSPWTASFYFHEPLRAVWTRCYDGVFFLDAEKPSTPLEKP
jgi:erythromycin esterase-like protein